MPYSVEQKYNPSIWQDMTSNERSIYYMAEAYAKFARDRGDTRKYFKSAEVKQCPEYDRDGLYPADPLRQHKNWQYFEKVWERFKNDQSFDPQIYMDSIARHIPKTTKIYPAQLSTKKNIANYLEYRQSLKIKDNVDDDKRIMEGVMQSYKLISRKMGIKKLTKEDLYQFFNETKDNNILSEGLLFCMQEMISPYYFSVSKAFIRAYKEADQDIRDEILELDRLKDMSMLVKIKPRIYNFVQKIFGDDII